MVGDKKSFREETENQTKFFYENTKTFIFIATTAIGLTLYVHQTFATNLRVEKIEKEQSNQQKISCLMAIKLNVKPEDIKDICQLNIK